MDIYTVYLYSKQGGGYAVEVAAESGKLLCILCG